MGDRISVVDTVKSIVKQLTIIRAAPATPDNGHLSFRRFIAVPVCYVTVPYRYRAGQYWVNIVKLRGASPRNDGLRRAAVLRW